MLRLVMFCLVIAIYKNASGPSSTKTNKNSFRNNIITHWLQHERRLVWLVASTPTLSNSDSHHYQHSFLSDSYNSFPLNAAIESTSVLWKWLQSSTRNLLPCPRIGTLYFTEGILNTQKITDSNCVSWSLDVHWKRTWQLTAI